MGRLPAFTFVAGACLSISGCYEIEPIIPDGYVGGSAEPGWPPPRIYSADPFHPSNRLFQRLFVLRAGSTLEGPGDLGKGERWEDIPFSPRETFTALDQAEVAALLEVLSEARRPASSFPEEPSLRAILQSDLLSVAARIHGTGGFTRELSEDLFDAAASLSADSPSQPAILPPPLGEPGWEERAGPRAPGLRPSAADLRWTRVFRRGTDREGALVRLRIGIGPAGEPVLFPIGSEAWILTAGSGRSPAPRVFRFRRSRAAGGEDPWIEVPEGVDVAIRDPLNPGGPPLTGKPDSLCGRCHPGPSIGPILPPGEPSGEAGDQLEDARRALKSISFRRGEGPGDR